MQRTILTEELTFCQDLFVKLLTLRGHFAVINDNAQFYSLISRDHIMPALHDVGKLPIDSTSEQHRHRQAALLQERTIYSAEAIQAIGAKVSCLALSESIIPCFLLADM